MSVQEERSKFRDEHRRNRGRMMDPVDPAACGRPFADLAEKLARKGEDDPKPAFLQPRQTMRAPARVTSPKPRQPVRQPERPSGVIVLRLSAKKDFGDIPDTLGDPEEAFGHLGDTMTLELRNQRGDQVVRTILGRREVAD